MGEEVVIFGLGDFARTACVYLEADSPHRVAAFTVHQKYMDRTQELGKPVVPFEELTTSHPPERFAMVVALGYSRVNHTRAEIFQECKARGYRFISYVNSRAANWGHVNIGENSFIFEHNTLQPFVTIGDNVVLWSGNHIGHDSTIGDHCFISSHVVISSNCKVGPYSFLGVNATLRDKITLGEGCVVGAGALILRDAPPRSVFRGTGTEPAKVTSDLLRF